MAAAVGAASLMASCTRTPSSCRGGCPGKEAQSQRSWRASAVRRPARSCGRRRGPGLPRCIGGVALDADAVELASTAFPWTPTPASWRVERVELFAVGRGRRRFRVDLVAVVHVVDRRGARGRRRHPALTLASVAETKTFRVDVGREPLLVEFEINGTRALAVGPTSPLAGIVRAGDVLVGVNGRAVSGASLMKVLYVEYRRTEEAPSSGAARRRAAAMRWMRRPGRWASRSAGRTRISRPSSPSHKNRGFMGLSAWATRSRASTASSSLP